MQASKKRLSPRAISSKPVIDLPMEFLWQQEPSLLNRHPGDKVPLEIICFLLYDLSLIKHRIMCVFQSIRKTPSDSHPAALPTALLPRENSHDA